MEENKRNEEVFTSDNSAKKGEGSSRELTQEQIKKIHEDFFNAIRSGNINLVKVFLEKYQSRVDIVNKTETKIKQTSLFLATLLGDRDKGYEISKLLIEYGLGGNVRHVDYYGQTCMYYICRDGKERLFDLHISSGVEVNHVDGHNQTCLFYAAREGNISMVRKLLKLGCNVNQLDNFQENCLFYAAREGKYDVCRALIESGVNVNQVDKMNQTALFFAKKSKRKNVATLLIENGAVNTKTGKITKTKPVSRKGISKHSQSSRLSNMKKKKKRTRYTYRLVFTDEQGESRELTVSEFKSFQERYPKVSALMLDASAIPEDKLDENYESWEDVASQILNTIWRFKGAAIFHKAVDPIRYGIPDYFTVIKTPMDLGTVKKKLQCNVYSNVYDWINDMNLIFENCKLYNGTISEVGKIGVSCHEEFKRLINVYKIVEKYTKRLDEGGYKPEEPAISDGETEEIKEDREEGNQHNGQKDSALDMESLGLGNQNTGNTQINGNAQASSVQPGIPAPNQFLG